MSVVREKMFHLFVSQDYQFLREHGEYCCECNWNVYSAWPSLALIFVLHSLAFARICNWTKQWNPTEGTFTDWWLLFGSSLFCLSGLLHFKSSGAGFNGQNFSAILVFPFSLEFFMGLFGTTDPRAVHSAWVLVIFGCGHTCLGESLKI